MEISQERLAELRTMPYEEYLSTPEWLVRRDQALERTGSRCQVCYGSDNLNVHHRTYERRGNEDPMDLTVLCQSCHSWFHRRMSSYDGLAHVTASIQEMLEKFTRPEDFVVPTGFRDLDRCTGLLQKGQFILIGGRSGQGAIPLAVNIGINAVLFQKSVAFFSFIANREYHIEQVLSIKAKTNFSQLSILEKWEDAQFESLADTTTSFQDLPYWVSDTAKTADDIERQVGQLIADHGQVDLVIVDSLDLIETSGKEFPDQRIATVSRSLKLIARKFHLPVIAVCQVAQSSTRSASNPPLLSDAKNAETFADICLMTHRESVYDSSAPSNLLDVFILKNHGGLVGMVTLSYNAEHCHIEDLEQNEHSPQ
jgi:replicative DNA helicase